MYFSNLCKSTITIDIKYIYLFLSLMIINVIKKRFMNLEVNFIHDFYHIFSIDILRNVQTFGGLCKENFASNQSDFFISGFLFLVRNFSSL